MPPAGAFGMNTGIQDAHNLAWKLAAVVAGRRAGPAGELRPGAPAGRGADGRARRPGGCRRASTTQRAGKIWPGGRSAAAGERAAPPEPTPSCGRPGGDARLLVRLVRRGGWPDRRAVAGGSARTGWPWTAARHAGAAPLAPGAGRRRSTLDLFEGSSGCWPARKAGGWLDALQIAASARRLEVKGYLVARTSMPWTTSRPSARRSASARVARCWSGRTASSAGGARRRAAVARTAGRALPILGHA